MSSSSAAGGDTDPYFTSANKLEVYSNGLVVQANPHEPLEWEAWVPLTPEEVANLTPEHRSTHKNYEGVPHTCVALAPWWFARNSLL